MKSEYGPWEPVVGLEVHAQLLTQSKLFCGCATSFGAPPNQHVCPVCLGLPGALPVLNGAALRMAVVAGLALDCRINPTSIFARKNYFYPDLPKGYQISQYEDPLAVAGQLALTTDDGPRQIRINRVHMEEDAGKNVHGVGGRSVIDLNRAGVPLIEIVSEPDLRACSEAKQYLKQLREILMFIGVNDGNLEQGSFRCDANVSIRKQGDPTLGTRVELKNINSFRFVEEAIDIETRRQIRLLESGAKVRLQTRGYNSDKRESYLLREKEGDAGYRYFPEPDLPPLVVQEREIEDLSATLPELPDAKRQRFSSCYGLSPNAAGVLTGHPQLAAFFERAARLSEDPVRTGNFLQAELLRDIKADGLQMSLPVSAEQLGKLVRLVKRGKISGKQAKEVYQRLKGSDRDPDELVASLGMAMVSDEATLQPAIAKLLAEHPGQVASYRGGKTALLGFFVGRLMKATKGRADPKLASELLRAALDAGEPPGGAQS